MTGVDQRERSGPLADPRLLRLIVGEGLAAVVEAVFLVWLTLYVLDLAGPGTATGVVLAAAALPRAVLLLPAGVLVDRFDPAVVATSAAWARVSVLLGLTALVALTSPSLTTIAVLAGLLGVVDAAYFPAALALLPRVAPRVHLSRVNALIQGAESGGDLIGPAVAAGAVAVVGFSVTLGAIAAVALLAAIVLVALVANARSQVLVEPGTTGGHDSDALVDGDRRSPRRALGDGLRYARRDPLVRAMLAVLAVLNVAVVGPVLVGGAMLADERLGGSGSLGVVFSGFGAGSLIGLLAAGRRPPARRGWTMIAGIVAIGAGTAGLAVVGGVVAATAVVAVIGLGSAFLGVVLVATLQEHVPGQLLGRVMSLVVLATMAFDPLSYALAGVLLGAGTTVLFLCCGGAILICAGLASTNVAVRSLR